MDGLNTVLEYLTSVPAWYLATSVDGQPHVRPFSFAQIQDGKLSAKKDGDDWYWYSLKSKDGSGLKYYANSKNLKETELEGWDD